MFSDKQIQKLNDHFNEVNTNLLLCIACLSPKKIILNIDKKKLIQFAEHYLEDFLTTELMRLEDQLQTYIVDETFFKLKGMGDLAKKMV